MKIRLLCRCCFVILQLESCSPHSLSLYGKQRPGYSSEMLQNKHKCIINYYMPSLWNLYDNCVRNMSRFRKIRLLCWYFLLLFWSLTAAVPIHCHIWKISAWIFFRNSPFVSHGMRVINDMRVINSDLFDFVGNLSL